MSTRPIKPQPTLKGYTAWAFTRLIAIQGVSQAEGISWIVDRWLQIERDHLELQYGISPQKYRDELALTGGDFDS